VKYILFKLVKKNDQLTKIPHSNLIMVFFFNIRAAQENPRDTITLY